MEFRSTQPHQANRVVVRDEAIRKRLLKLGRSGQFLRTVRMMIEKEAPSWRDEVRRRISTRWRRGDDQTKVRPLRKRSGALLKAIDYKVTSPGNHAIAFQLGVLTKHPVYARLHELGDPAYISRGSARMTIPLDAALDSRGVRKFTARTARNFYQATWARGEVVFGRIGRKVVPLFILRDVVKTVQRPYLAPTVEKLRKRLRVIVRAAYAQTRGAP